MQGDNKQGDTDDHGSDERGDSIGLGPVSGVIAEPTGTEHQHQGNNGPTSGWSDRLNRLNRKVQWLFILNVVIAFGTAAQAYYAYRALIELNRTTALTSESIELTRVAMQIDARAWVSINTAYISPFPITDKPRVFIDFANHGKTPATDVKEIEIDLGFTEPCGSHSHTGLPEPYSRGTSSMTLGPNTSPGVRQREIPFSKTDLVKNLYVFGGVEYLDIFKRRHVTRYCFLYEPNLTPFPEKPDRVGLVWCGCHNDVD